MATTTACTLSFISTTSKLLRQCHSGTWHDLAPPRFSTRSRGECFRRRKATKNAVLAFSFPPVSSISNVPASIPDVELSSIDEIWNAILSFSFPSESGISDVPASITDVELSSIDETKNAVLSFSFPPVSGISDVPASIPDVELSSMDEAVNGVASVVQRLASALESTGAQALGGDVEGLARELEDLPDATWIKVALFILLWVYLTARPGVISGIFDMYFLSPLQLLADASRGRSSFQRNDFVLGKRIGEGSFGTVYMGALLRPKARLADEPGRRSVRLEDVDPSLQQQRVVLKKVKVGVPGAEECGEMEEWFNRRMMRAAPSSCAEFLGSFVADATRGQFTQGGKWLVWKYEGESTLLDYMRERDFPNNLEGVLFGRSLRGEDSVRRNAVVVKAVMRQIIMGLKSMHSTGIVHRDVKPANIVVADKGKLKLIDFGAATDLRIGRNYIPDRGMLDPDFCPPEQLVLPEATPDPPPAIVAAALSPFLWQWQHPDLFDMYSAGLVMLQLACPQLRGSTGWQQFRSELSRMDFDLRAWRSNTNIRANLDILDIDGGQGWELVQKLVCLRGPFRRGRLSAAAALRHPYFLLGSDVAASALSKLSFSR